MRGTNQETMWKVRLKSGGVWGLHCQGSNPNCAIYTLFTQIVFNPNRSPCPRL